MFCQREREKKGLWGGISAPLCAKAEKKKSESEQDGLKKRRLRGMIIDSLASRERERVSGRG